MNRAKSILFYIAVVVLFFFSWALFYADGKLLHHPIAALYFLAGGVSAFLSVYSRLRRRACLIGFIAFSLVAVMYTLFNGAPIFAAPVALLFIVVAGAVPFGAGYLVGYWLAMGGKIIAYKMHDRFCN